jgi:hypothetical protein
MTGPATETQSHRVLLKEKPIKLERNNEDLCASVTPWQNPVKSGRAGDKLQSAPSMPKNDLFRVLCAPAPQFSSAGFAVQFT